MIIKEKDISKLTRSMQEKINELDGDNKFLKENIQAMEKNIKRLEEIEVKYNNLEVDFEK